MEKLGSSFKPLPLHLERSDNNDYLMGLHEVVFANCLTQKYPEWSFIPSILACSCANTPGGQELCCGSVRWWAVWFSATHELQPLRKVVTACKAHYCSPVRLPPKWKCECCCSILLVRPLRYLETHVLCGHPGIKPYQDHCS